MNHSSQLPIDIKLSDSRPDRLKWVSICAGILSAILGMVVLIGWYTHNANLIQVHRTFVPMQYNTALGFLLCGMAMVLILLEKFRPAALLASIAGLIGLLTLAEYLFNINIGIDQLFMKHYITVQTSHPGRMAPNTALCFVLTAGYILMMQLREKLNHISVISGITAALILALGATAFGSYLSGLHTAYGWGNLTRMAIHTSASFCILGIGALNGFYLLMMKQPS
ncbi:MAG: hypothetical protein PF482_20450 [Desulfobacteraceae bacterium]|jgi:hypothetical protein|nr:hypothetical protein [Desulfobacteraceae bacterium]